MRGAAPGRRAGFTLIELVVAMAVASLLLVPLGLMLRQSADQFADTMTTFRLNQEAREIASRLGDGEVLTTRGTDGIPYAYGVRGMRREPTVRTVRSRMEVDSNNGMLRSSELPEIAIVCRRAREPHPGCPRPHITLRVAGYLATAIDHEREDSGLPDRYIGYTLELEDPMNLRAGTGRTEQYRMGWQILREHVDAEDGE